MADMTPLTLGNGEKTHHRAAPALDSMCTASKPPSPRTNDGGNHLLEDSSVLPLYLTTEKPEPLATETVGA